MTTMIRRGMLVAALVLMTTAASAQDLFTHFYVVPKVGIGDQNAPEGSFHNPFGPKYLPHTSIGYYETFDFGRENAVIACAYVTDAEHTKLSANIDVVAIPDLDTKVTAAGLGRIQSNLAGLKVPSDDLTSATTWREVVSRLLHTFAINQRFDGLRGATLFSSNVTLDKRADQLTADQKTDLVTVGQSFGLDTTIVNGSNTVNTVLKSFDQQMGQSYLYMCQNYF